MEDDESFSRSSQDERNSGNALVGNTSGSKTDENVPLLNIERVDGNVEPSSTKCREVDLVTFPQNLSQCDLPGTRESLRRFDSHEFRDLLCSAFDMKKDNNLSCDERLDGRKAYHEKLENRSDENVVSYSGLTHVDSLGSLFRALFSGTASVGHAGWQDNHQLSDLTCSGVHGNPGGEGLEGKETYGQVCSGSHTCQSAITFPPTPSSSASSIPHLLQPAAPLRAATANNNNTTLTTSPQFPAPTSGALVETPESRTPNYDPDFAIEILNNGSVSKLLPNQKYPVINKDHNRETLSRLHVSSESLGQGSVSDSENRNSDTAPSLEVLPPNFSKAKILVSEGPSNSRSVSSVDNFVCDEQQFICDNVHFVCDKQNILHNSCKQAKETAAQDVNAYSKPRNKVTFQSENEIRDAVNENADVNIAPNYSRYVKDGQVFKNCDGLCGEEYQLQLAAAVCKQPASSLQSRGSTEPVADAIQKRYDGITALSHSERSSNPPTLVDNEGIIRALCAVHSARKCGPSQEDGTAFKQTNQVATCFSQLENVFYNPDGVAILNSTGKREVCCSTQLNSETDTTATSCEGGGYIQKTTTATAAAADDSLSNVADVVSPRYLESGGDVIKSIKYCKCDVLCACILAGEFSARERQSPRLEQTFRPQFRAGPPCGTQGTGFQHVKTCLHLSESRSCCCCCSDRDGRVCSGHQQVGFNYRSQGDFSLKGLSLQQLSSQLSTSSSSHVCGPSAVSDDGQKRRTGPDATYPTFDVSCHITYNNNISSSNKTVTHLETNLPVSATPVWAPASECSEFVDDSCSYCCRSDYPDGCCDRQLQNRQVQEDSGGGYTLLHSQDKLESRHVTSRECGTDKLEFFSVASLGLLNSCIFQGSSQANSESHLSGQRATDTYLPSQRATDTYLPGPARSVRYIGCEVAPGHSSDRCKCLPGDCSLHCGRSNNHLPPQRSGAASDSNQSINGSDLLSPSDLAGDSLTKAASCAQTRQSSPRLDGKVECPRDFRTLRVNRGSRGESRNKVDGDAVRSSDKKDRQILTHFNKNKRRSSQNSFSVNKSSLCLERGVDVVREKTVARSLLKCAPRAACSPHRQAKIVENDAIVSSGSDRLVDQSADVSGVEDKCSVQCQEDKCSVQCQEDKCSVQCQEDKCSVQCQEDKCSVQCQEDKCSVQCQEDKCSVQWQKDKCSVQCQKDKAKSEPAEERSNRSSSPRRHFRVRQTRTSVLRQFGQHHKDADASLAPEEALTFRPDRTSSLKSQRIPQHRKGNLTKNVKLRGTVKIKNTSEIMADVVTVSNSHSLTRRREDKTHRGLRTKYDLDTSRDNSRKRQRNDLEKVVRDNKVDVLGTKLTTTAENISTRKTAPLGQTHSQKQPQLLKKKREPSSEAVKSCDSDTDLRGQKDGTSKSPPAGPSLRFIKQAIPSAPRAAPGLTMSGNKLSTKQTHKKSTVLQKVSRKDNQDSWSHAGPSPPCSEHNVLEATSAPEMHSSVTSSVLSESETISSTSPDENVTSSLNTDKDFTSQNRRISTTSKMCNGLPRTSLSKTVHHRSSSLQCKSSISSQTRRTNKSPSSSPSSSPKERLKLLKSVSPPSPSSSSSSSSSSRTKSTKLLLSTETISSKVAATASLTASSLSSTQSTTATVKVSPRLHRTAQNRSSSFLPVPKRRGGTSDMGPKTPNTDSMITDSNGIFRIPAGETKEADERKEVDEREEVDERKEMKPGFCKKSSHELKTNFSTSQTGQVDLKGHRRQKTGKNPQKLTPQVGEHDIQIQDGETELGLIDTVEVEGGMPPVLSPVMSEDEDTTVYIDPQRGVSVGEYSCQDRIDCSKMSHENDGKTHNSFPIDSELPKRGFSGRDDFEQMTCSRDLNEKVTVGKYKVREVKGRGRSVAGAGSVKTVSRSQKNVKESENSLKKQEPVLLPPGTNLKVILRVSPPSSTQVKVIPRVSPPSSAQVKVIPRVSPPSSTQVKVISSVPPPSSTQVKVISSVPPPSSAQVKVIPSVSAPSSAQVKVIPSVPQLSSAQAKVIPRVPPPSSTQVKVIPSLPPPSSTQVKVIPSLPPPSSTQVKVIPSLPPPSSTQVKVQGHRLRKAAAIPKYQVSTTRVQNVAQMNDQVSREESFDVQTDHTLYSHAKQARTGNSELTKSETKSVTVKTVPYSSKDNNSLTKQNSLPKQASSPRTGRTERSRDPTFKSVNSLPHSSLSAKVAASSMNLIIESSVDGRCGDSVSASTGTSSFTTSSVSSAHHSKSKESEGQKVNAMLTSNREISSSCKLSELKSSNIKANSASLSPARRASQTDRARNLGSLVVVKGSNERSQISPKLKKHTGNGAREITQTIKLGVKGSRDVTGTEFQTKSYSSNKLRVDTSRVDGQEKCQVQAEAMLLSKSGVSEKAKSLSVHSSLESLSQPRLRDPSCSPGHAGREFGRHSHSYVTDRACDSDLDILIRCDTVIGGGDLESTPNKEHNVVQSVSTEHKSLPDKIIDCFADSVHQIQGHSLVLNESSMADSRERISSDNKADFAGISFHDYKAEDHILIGDLSSSQDIPNQTLNKDRRSEGPGTSEEETVFLASSKKSFPRTLDQTKGDATTCRKQAGFSSQATHTEKEDRTCQTDERPELSLNESLYRTAVGSTMFQESCNEHDGRKADNGSDDMGEDDGESSSSSESSFQSATSDILLTPASPPPGEHACFVECEPGTVEKGLDKLITLDSENAESICWSDDPHTVHEYGDSDETELFSDCSTGDTRITSIKLLTSTPKVFKNVESCDRTPSLFSSAQLMDVRASFTICVEETSVVSQATDDSTIKVSSDETCAHLGSPGSETVRELGEVLSVTREKDDPCSLIKEHNLSQKDATVLGMTDDTASSTQSEGIITNPPSQQQSCKRYNDNVDVQTLKRESTSTKSRIFSSSQMTAVERRSQGRNTAEHETFSSLPASLSVESKISDIKPASSLHGSPSVSNDGNSATAREHQPHHSRIFQQPHQQQQHKHIVSSQPPSQPWCPPAGQPWCPSAGQPWCPPAGQGDEMSAEYWTDKSGSVAGDRRTVAESEAEVSSEQATNSFTENAVSRHTGQLSENDGSQSGTLSQSQRNTLIQSPGSQKMIKLSDSNKMIQSSDNVQSSDSQKIIQPFDSNKMTQSSDNIHSSDSQNIIQSSDLQKVIQPFDSNKKIRSSDSQRMNPPSHLQRITQPSNSQRMTQPSNSQRMTRPSESQKMTQPSVLQRMTQSSESQKMTQPSDSQKTLSSKELIKLPNLSVKDKKMDDSHFGLKTETKTATLHHQQQQQQAAAESAVPTHRRKNSSTNRNIDLAIELQKASEGLGQTQCQDLVTERGEVTSDCPRQASHDKADVAAECPQCLLPGNQKKIAYTELRQDYGDSLEVSSSVDYSEANEFRSNGFSFHSVAGTSDTRTSLFESGYSSDIKSPDVNSPVQELEDEQRNSLQTVLEASTSATLSSVSSPPAFLPHPVETRCTSKNVPDTKEPFKNEAKINVNQFGSDLSRLSTTTGEGFEKVGPETLQHGKQTDFMAQECETLNHDTGSSSQDVSTSMSEGGHSRNIQRELSPQSRDNLETLDKAQTRANTTNTPRVSEIISNNSQNLESQTYGSEILCKECEKQEEIAIFDKTSKQDQVTDNVSSVVIRNMQENSMGRSMIGFENTKTSFESLKIAGDECVSQASRSCNSDNGAFKLNTAKCGLALTDSFGSLCSSDGRDSRLHPSEKYMCTSARDLPTNTFLNSCVDFGHNIDCFNSTITRPSLLTSEHEMSGPQITTHFRCDYDKLIQLSEQNSSNFKGEFHSKMDVSRSCGVDITPDGFYDNGSHKYGVEIFTSNFHENTVSGFSQNYSGKTCEGENDVKTEKKVLVAGEDDYTSSLGDTFDCGFTDKVSKTGKIHSVYDVSDVSEGDQSDVFKCKMNEHMLISGTRDNATSTGSEDALCRECLYGAQKRFLPVKPRSLSFSGPSSLSLCLTGGHTGHVCPELQEKANETDESLQGSSKFLSEELISLSQNDKKRPSNPEICLKSDAEMIIDGSLLGKIEEIKRSSEKKKSEEKFVDNEDMKKKSITSDHNIVSVLDVNYSAKGYREDSKYIQQEDTTKAQTIAAITKQGKVAAKQGNITIIGQKKEVPRTSSPEGKAITVRGKQTRGSDTSRLSVGTCSQDLNTGSQSPRRLSPTPQFEGLPKETSPFIMEKVYELLSKVSCNEQRNLLRTRSFSSYTETSKSPGSMTTSLAPDERTSSPTENERAMSPAQRERAITMSQNEGGTTMTQTEGGTTMTQTEGGTTMTQTEGGITMTQNEGAITMTHKEKTTSLGQRERAISRIQNERNTTISQNERATSPATEERAKVKGKWAINKWRSFVRRSKAIAYRESLKTKLPRTDARRSSLPPPPVSPTPPRTYKWVRGEAGIWKKVYTDDDDETKEDKQIGGRITPSDSTNLSEQCATKNTSSSSNSDTQKVMTDHHIQQTPDQDNPLVETGHEDIASCESATKKQLVAVSRSENSRLLQNRVPVSRDQTNVNHRDTIADKSETSPRFEQKTESGDFYANTKKMQESRGLLSTKYSLPVHAAPTDVKDLKIKQIRDESVYEKLSKFQNKEDPYHSVLNLVLPVASGDEPDSDLVSCSSEAHNKKTAQVLQLEIGLGNSSTEMDHLENSTVLESHARADHFVDIQHTVSSRSKGSSHSVLARSDATRSACDSADQLSDPQPLSPGNALEAQKTSASSPPQRTRQRNSAQTDPSYGRSVYPNKDLSLPVSAQSTCNTTSLSGFRSKDKTMDNATNKFRTKVSQKSKDSNLTLLDEAKIIAEDIPRENLCQTEARTPILMKSVESLGKAESDVYLSKQRVGSREKFTQKDANLTLMPNSPNYMKNNLTSGASASETSASFSGNDKVKDWHHLQDTTVSDQKTDPRSSETEAVDDLKAEKVEDSARAENEDQASRKYTWPTVAESLKRFQKSIAVSSPRVHLQRGREQQFAIHIKKETTVPSAANNVDVEDKPRTYKGIGSSNAVINYGRSKDHIQPFKYSTTSNSQGVQPNESKESTIPGDVTTSGNEISSPKPTEDSDFSSPEVRRDEPPVTVPSVMLPSVRSPRPHTLNPPQQASSSVQVSHGGSSSTGSNSCWSAPSAAELTLPPSPVITLSPEAVAARDAPGKALPLVDHKKISLARCMESSPLSDSDAVTPVPETSAPVFQKPASALLRPQPHSQQTNTVSPLQSHQHNQLTQQTSQSSLSHGLPQEIIKNVTTGSRNGHTETTLVTSSATRASTEAPEQTSVSSPELGVRQHIPSTKLISVSVWDPSDRDWTLRSARRLWTSEDKHTLTGILETEEAQASHDSSAVKSSSSEVKDSVLLQAGDDCKERVRTSRSPVRPHTKQKRAPRRSLSLPSGGLSYGDVKILYKDGHFVMVDTTGQKGPKCAGEAGSILEDVSEETSRMYTDNKSSSAEYGSEDPADAEGSMHAEILSLLEKGITEPYQTDSKPSMSFDAWDASVAGRRTGPGASIFYSLPRRKGQGQRAIVGNDVKLMKYCSKSQQSLLSQVEMERKKRDEQQEEDDMRYHEGSCLKRNNSFTEAMGSSVHLDSSDRGRECSAVTASAELQNTEHTDSDLKHIQEESQGRKSRSKGPGFIHRILHKRKGVTTEKSSLKPNQNDLSTSSLSLASVSSTSLQQTSTCKSESRESSVGRKISFREFFKRKSSSDMSARRSSSGECSSPPIATFLSSDDIGATVPPQFTENMGEVFSECSVGPGDIKSLSPHLCRSRSARTPVSASSSQSSLFRSFSHDDSDGTPVAHQTESVSRRARSLSERTRQHGKVSSSEHFSGDSFSEYDLNSPDVYNSDGTLTPRSTSPCPGDVSLEGDQTLLASPAPTNRLSPIAYRKLTSSPQQGRRRTSVGERTTQKSKHSTLNQSMGYGETINSSSDSGIQKDLKMNSSTESIQGRRKAGKSQSPSPTLDRIKSDNTVRWADLLGQRVEASVLRHRKEAAALRKRPRPTSDTADEKKKDERPEEESKDGGDNVDDDEKGRVRNDENEDDSEASSGACRSVLINASSLGNINTTAVTSSVSSSTCSATDLRLLMQSRESLLSLVELRRPCRDAVSTRLAKLRRLSTPQPITVRAEKPKVKPARSTHVSGVLSCAHSMPENLDKLTRKKNYFSLIGWDAQSVTSQHSVCEDSSDESEYSMDYHTERPLSTRSSQVMLEAIDQMLEEDNLTYAEALWDHVTMDPDELAFRAGDLIRVTEASDKHWWYGILDDIEGWFPATFVRLRVNQDVMGEELAFLMTDEEAMIAPDRAGTTVTSLSYMGKQQARANVVNEIIGAEREYVKHLQDVVEGYLKHTRKRPEMFPAEKISTIFSNIEEIYWFADELLADLEKSINHEQPHLSELGHCFLDKVKSFEMYSDYCNNHSAACEELRELYRNKRYRHFFEACRLLQEMIEIPLEGFLLTPVQKICKYHLQLAELFKFTPPEHPDFSSVQGALEAMKKIAMLINERKRKMESVEKLAAWQLLVDGWEGPDILTDSSELIYSGELNKINHAGWSQERYFFLFDHQLIYCKKDLLKKSSFCFKGRISMDSCEITNIPDGRDLQYSVNVRNAWKLHDAANKKWYLLVAKTSVAKQRWLKAFQDERRRVKDDTENNFYIPNHVKQAVINNFKQKTSLHKPKGKGVFSRANTAQAISSINRVNAIATLPRTKKRHKVKAESTLGKDKKINWFFFGKAKS